MIKKVFRIGNNSFIINANRSISNNEGYCRVEITDGTFITISINEGYLMSFDAESKIMQEFINEYFFDEIQDKPRMLNCSRKNIY